MIVEGQKALSPNRGRVWCYIVDKPMPRADDIDKVSIIGKVGDNFVDHLASSVESLRGTINGLLPPMGARGALEGEVEPCSAVSLAQIISRSQGRENKSLVIGHQGWMGGIGQPTEGNVNHCEEKLDADQKVIVIATVIAVGGCFDCGASTKVDARVRR